MKLYVVAGLAAVLIGSELVIAAPPASAGCIDPAGIPMAQMCDSPVDTDGMWERCLTTYPGGPLNPANIACNTMSAGDLPKEADPVFLTPPTHIDG